MPDSKITALTSIGASTDPANDPLVLVDVSDTSMAATGTTKKVTLNQLLGASGTATLASATITGDLTVDSNVRVGASPAFYGGKIATNGSIAIAQGNYLKLWNSTGNGVAGINAGAADTLTFSLTNTFTTAMTLNATGLGVGIVPSSFGRFSVQGTAVSAGILGMNTDATRCDIQSYNVPLALNRAGNNITMCEGGGNVGVGVSPNFKLDIAGAANSAPITLLRLNNIGTTGGGPGIAARLQFNAGATALGFVQGCNFASGSIGVQISGDGTNIHQTIDSSGNVGIGVTPKSWASGYRALQLGVYSALTDAAGGATYLTNNAYFDSVDSRWEYITNNRVVRYDQDTADGGHKWYSAAAGAVNAAITWGNPLMTLDASGNLLVGTTTNGGNGVSIRPSTASPNVVLVGSDTSGGTAWQLYSTGTSSNRFYVTWAGVVNAVNTTISGISDARLKENVQDIDVGLGAILALKPRKFDWKAGKGKDIKGDRGFIAQEFEQVFPQLVDEWADPAPEGEAPYKSVRQDLIPVLVKAIQELAAEVNALKNA